MAIPPPLATNPWSGPADSADAHVFNTNPSPTHFSTTMQFAPIGRLLGAFALIVSVLALVPNDWLKKQVLIVHDPKIAPERDVLTTLFQVNEDYEVTFVEYSDVDQKLFLGDDAIYDDVVYLPSTKKVVGAKDLVRKHTVLEFFNKGGNVVAIGSDKYSFPDEVRSFLNEVGIFPAPKGFVVSSHFNKKNALDASNLAGSPIYPEITPLNYEGTSALLSNSEFVFPLVKAPKLSYTASPKDKVMTGEKTWTVGEQGFLAAAFQGLNNARGVWLGSLDLVTDSLVEWVFQETGMLKLQFVEHYKADEPGTKDKTLYRIKDDVYYTIGVSEFQKGEWVPFVPSSEDNVIQLAFKMLDPYQRLNLTLLGPGASVENGKNDLSIFFVEFTLPDHHGMFTFELDYKREGLSFIEDKRIVAVRHLANDEFKRSWDISNSWLYVASASFVVVGWFFFVLNFLFLGTAKPVVVAEKAAKK